MTPGMANGREGERIGPASDRGGNFLRVHGVINPNSGVAPDDWVFYEVQFLFASFGTTCSDAVAQAAPTLNAAIVHYASDETSRGLHECGRCSGG